ncbi:hypothetical protein [uncultured Phenylobacterium sp.]|uniref:hypothetical protein n=1 Tax=uncultured Phenylobacterium sp. TaxID=349273 RepID=UPI0025DFC9B9|nr:hypothetical protein [uncultured Phenylobacterium sp.]
MLSGVCEALAAEGTRLTLLSRRASAWRGAVVEAFDCDYRDEAGFASAVDAAVAHSGPVDVAVAWFHSVRLPANRRLAERIGAGTLVQVLGSATADPAHPDRLETARAVAEGLRCRLRQVVLGFQVEAGRSRWLTDREISLGVLGAVHRDDLVTVVGSVEPWSARP